MPKALWEEAGAGMIRRLQKFSKETAETLRLLFLLVRAHPWRVVAIILAIALLSLALPAERYCPYERDGQEIMAKYWSLPILEVTGVTTCEKTLRHWGVSPN